MSSLGEPTAQRAAPSAYGAEATIGGVEMATDTARPTSVQEQKREHTTGPFSKWRLVYGPSRPDPWLQRKIAVGYVVSVSNGGRG